MSFYIWPLNVPPSVQQKSQKQDHLFRDKLCSGIIPVFRNKQFIPDKLVIPERGNHFGTCQLFRKKVLFWSISNDESAARDWLKFPTMALIRSFFSADFGPSGRNVDLVQIHPDLDRRLQTTQKWHQKRVSAVEGTFVTAVDAGFAKNLQ
jgi:hypothetical protein